LNAVFSQLIVFEKQQRQSTEKDNKLLFVCLVGVGFKLVFY